MKKATIVQGLAFGDEGKGSIVDYLCATEKVDLVVRFNGGCQAAHNVVLKNGTHHCFSQFGSGSLRGVKTFLDRHVIIDPLALVQEAKHLHSIGFFNPLMALVIHPDCLITTPYHRALNRALDGMNNHGSCGLGIGVTREMWSQTGDGLRASDLRSKSSLRRKLDWIRQWCKDKLIAYRNPPSTVQLKTQSSHNEIEEDLLKYKPPVIDDGFFFLRRSDNIVFEGSQGFGLDEFHGTIPHTTYSDTTPTYAAEMCVEFRVKPKILGVCRSYGTRHGNGPLWGENSTAIHDSREHNVGGFAGLFRSGKFDLNLIMEAIKTCGVTEVAVNHHDFTPLAEHHSIRIEELAPITVAGYGPTSEEKLLKEELT